MAAPVAYNHDAPMTAKGGPGRSRLRRARIALAACMALLLSACPLAANEARLSLPDKIQKIDSDTPGELGVYLKHLGTGKELEYKTQRDWYVASLVKVPLAIAVLQATEKNRLSLDDQLTLQESDYVDGSGDLLYQDAGTQHSIGSLLKQSLEDSDSTATDMLMRRLGVDEFNQQVKTSMAAEGIGPFTTILQVRYDAYQELHPRAMELSNMDYVRFRAAGDFDKRVEAFKRKLGLDAGQLQVASLEEAFARYYQRDINTSRLQALGVLLERLVRGELLNAEHTDLLLGHMKKITTGDKRLKAGLPKRTPFAQKTGTQVERACNMGVAHPDSIQKAVVIVVCAEDFGDIKNAEKAFQRIAKTLQPAGWL